jgi:paraquat-inducible protein A
VNRHAPGLSHFYLPRLFPTLISHALASMALSVACHTCGLLQRVEPLEPGTNADCRRCGAVVASGKRGSLGRTAALSLAALILYVPANLYPILRMNLHGAYSESTVWDGCVSLFENGEYLVAVIVFLASMAIPLVKLLALFFLVAMARMGSALWRRQRAWMHRVIELIGPWAMLDVFLLAVLVALVKLDKLATILPGPGLVAFASMVVLTILASASFDPRLIWNNPEGRNGRQARAA